MRRDYPAAAVIFVLALSAQSPWDADATSQPERRMVRVGIYQNEPLVFLDETGTPQGFCIDLLEEVARTEGWELKYVPGTWPECLERLSAGKIDLLLPIAYSAERAERYAFSEVNYLSNWGQIYTRTGHELESILDLRDRKVALLRGDIYNQSLRGLLDGFGISCRLVEFDTYAEVLEAVASGQAEAGVLTRLYGRRYAERAGLHPTPIVFCPVELRVAAAKGRAPGLLAAWDRHVARLMREPGSAYYQALDRWTLGTHAPSEYALPHWMLWGLGLVVGVAVGALVFVLVLRRQVRHRTAELEKANRRLRESEERFRRLSESSSEGILIHEQGVLLDANRRTAEMFGYELDEMIGMDAFLLAAPESRPLLRKHVAEGYEQPYEAIGLRKDGSRFPVELIGRGIRFHGRHARVVAVRDLTERRKAEQQLRLTQYSVDKTADAVFWIREDGRFVYVNEGACRSLGYTRDELLTMSVPDIDPQYPKEKWPAKWEEVKRLGSCVFESCHRTRDGRVFPVEVRVNHVDFSGQEYHFAFARDITDRKRAEAERVLLATAIEQAAEAVVITSPEGSIQYVNPAFTRVTGYTAEEVFGKNPRLLKSGRHDEAFYRGLWETILAGRTWTGRFVNRRKDGTLYQEEATISPVRDQEGKITHFVAVKRDVTQELLLEDQLRQAQKMEAIGQLAGGVAHDFNNILTAILGNAELALKSLAKAIPEGAPALQGLRQIEHSAERAATLTRQLLAFSRRQVTQPQVIDLNRTLRDMEPMLRRLLTENVSLELVLDPDLHTVRADPGHMEQIVMNMVVNAGDAMPDGGVLTIETSNVELDEAYAATHAETRPGAHVLLAISDTGCGMDAQTMERIFEPFFTTKPEGRGTGLGLATVYGIVKQAGGNVRVYSEPGAGTTFKVYLPALEGEADEVASTSEETEAPLGTETVLLCEDDAAVRELAAGFLDSAGYTVLAAPDATSALELAGSHPGEIHLLITDVIMPDLNGRQLAERLAAKYPGLKTIYISGYTANVIAHHGVLDKGIIFLEKPFSRSALLRRVRAVLDQPAETRSPAAERDGARVLVVDDEPSVREVVRRALEQQGYRVSEAADAEQAARAIEAGDFDLVITDLVMPGHDGLETILRIREKQPRPKVIALGTPGDVLGRDNARSLGAAATLEKPLNLAELVAEVQRLLAD